MTCCFKEKEDRWVSGVFFFKQKTAYEVGTGDWSSDVCSSDLSFAASVPWEPG